MIEVNWNIGKTKRQIRSANRVIESYIIDGAFKPDKNEFAKKLYKLGYSWSDELNSVNNSAIDDLYNFCFSFFEKHGILNLPHGGTLLGFYRDGKSLPHDDDHDITVDYHTLSKYYDQFESEASENNYELSFNKKFINQGLGKEWFFWTKIYTKDVYKVLIGDYSFEFKNAIDIFPIAFFDTFEEFIHLSELYLLSYKSKGINMRFNKKRVKDRKQMLINEYGLENFEKISEVAEKLYDKEFILDKTTDQYIDEFNNIWKSKKDGKYFTTLTSQILYKKWRPTNSVFPIKTLSNGIKYRAWEHDESDLELYFNKDWKNVPEYGPLHSIASWSFKGKLRKETKF